MKSPTLCLDIFAGLTAAVVLPKAMAYAAGLRLRSSSCRSADHALLKAAVRKGKIAVFKEE